VAEHRRAPRDHAREVADIDRRENAGTKPFSVSSSITGTP
jgi:hypothetical protein